MSQISLFLPIRPVAPAARRPPAKSHRRLLLLAALFLVLVATRYVHADPAYVLGGGGKSIIRLDVQPVTVETKVPVPFRDDPMLTSPQGGGRWREGSTGYAVERCTVCSCRLRTVSQEDAEDAEKTLEPSRPPQVFFSPLAVRRSPQPARQKKTR